MQHQCSALRCRSLSDCRAHFLKRCACPVCGMCVCVGSCVRTRFFLSPQAARPCLVYSGVPLHETWAAMEALHRAGLAKHLGVCNLTCAGLRDVMGCASTVEHQPEVLQIERHVHLQQPKLLRMATEVYFALLPELILLVHFFFIIRVYVDFAAHP